MVITVAVLPPELRLPAIHNSDDSAHNYGNYHDDDHRGNDDVYHSLDDESGHLDDCTSHYLFQRRIRSARRLRPQDAPSSLSPVGVGLQRMR